MINTKSKFWYGWEVTAENNLLDFKLDSDLTPKQAIFKYGKYSASQLCAEIKRALEASGAAFFEANFDRASKCFTISSDTGFSILSNSGSSFASGSVCALLGLSTVFDHTGASSYTAEYSSCIEFIPQFKLQSVSNVGDRIVLRDATLNETASGDTELIHFGEIQKIEFEILFITNIIQPNEDLILNNQNAVQEARDFLRWATKKARVEYMPDINDSETFYELILEATPDDSKGMGFRLTEQYADKLPNYFKTGLLQWRIAE